MKEKIVAFLSPLLAKPLLFLIVFLIPTQLSKHFWPHSSFIYGIRVDYLSPAIYLIDLLILVFLFLYSPKKHILKSILPLNLVFLVNLMFSYNVFITATQILRINLYLLFFLSLINQKNLKIIKTAISYSIYFQTILVIMQMVKNSSVGGVFYWFGERQLSITAPNVAKTILSDAIVLRAYGTFSHPNVLAGWLITSLLILITLRSSKKSLFLNSLLITLLIILTRSRAAMLVQLILVIPLLIKKTKRITYYLFLVLVGIIFTHVVASYFAHSPESIYVRLSLLYTSLDILRHNPIFGSGLGASISMYPTISTSSKILQPDHNLITLILAQLGLILIPALPYLGNIRRVNWRVLYLAPIFFLDHYFLTSTQGILSLLLLAFSATYVGQTNNQQHSSANRG